MGDSLSKKGLVIGLIIGLVIGLVLGYAVLPLPAEVDTTELEQRISDLEGQVNTLQGEIDDKDNQITNLQSQIAELQSQIEELEQLVPPLRKGEWNTIISFTGSTGKTTELFYIPGENWRINWSYTNGELALFGFFVYPEGETAMFVETLTSMGPSQSDTTYIYRGPGSFYITLSAANVEEWTLTIEAFVSE